VVTDSIHSQTWRIWGGVGSADGCVGVINCLTIFFSDALEEVVVVLKIHRAKDTGLSVLLLLQVDARVDVLVLRS